VTRRAPDSADGPAGRGHPTIIDVAKRAGVSKSLVSLVMQGSLQVSDEKRDAVMQAAHELRYRPNAVARSLVRKRSFLIGVMLSDLHNPFFVEVVDGIQAEALRAGYDALFNTGGRTAAGESSAIESLLQLRTDGLILASPVLSSREIRAAAVTAPVVLVARPSRWPEVDSVTNDDRAGACLAIEHLAELGHRSIAHIDGGKGAGAAARRAGYKDAMRARGLERRCLVIPGEYTEKGGADGVERLLASNHRPTAIFAANDLAAIGAMQAIEERGLQVPGDLSLVGYDNTGLAALRHIDLTTIDQPRQGIGATAVRLLLDRLGGGRRRARHVLMQPSLVVRGTTAAP
jgi:DNA-binding LacI/PurR family transcriptional regulator